MRVMKRLLCKGIFISFLCFIFLIGLPLEAKAVTYIYRTDPTGGVPVWYVQTTTTTAVGYIQTTYSTDEGAYYYATLSYDLGEYSIQITNTGGSTYSNTRRAASKILMSGLAPGTNYTLTYQGTYKFTYSSYYNTYYSNLYPLQITTDPVVPTSPTFTNITQSGVNINWTSNGNGGATRYILYRGTSASGPWVTVYDGTGFYYSDQGLASNTTYYYRLGSYVSGGAEYYATTLSITTNSDPAVSAALAAQGAAEASMVASQSAQTSVNNMTAEFQAVKTDITAIKASLEADLVPPTIAKFVYSTPYITALRTDAADFILEAYDNKTDTANLSYRYKVNDGAYSGWTNLTTSGISINVGSTRGIKHITVEVMDSSGKVSSTTARLWRL